jgi:hypothetical protein
MNIIGIYPVSSQPPHLGHYKAYEFLKKLTGNNTFVATSNKVELPQAPLSFPEKQQIWARHGVPIDKIVETKDPYHASEITKKFGFDRTSVIFAMSQSEAQTLLQDSKGYFVKFAGDIQNLESMSKHGYILVIPDAIFTISGKSINGQTIRQALSSTALDIEKKKSFFKQVFGWYDISLFDLVSKRFSEASTVRERVDEANMMVLRRTLTPFIKEILGQMTTAQGQGTQPAAVSPLSTDTALTPAEIQKQKQDAQKQRDAQLKQKEVELKTAKKERDFQKQKVDQVNRFTVPNITKDIQKLKGAKI